jgi:NADH:ubiquinone oxidoreductase subunit K
MNAAMPGPGLTQWLLLSAALFSIGLYGLLTRRNAVGILIAVELMLNSAAMNFVIFNRFLHPQGVDGQIMAIFVIAVAAAEVVVGMAIFVALFRHRGTVDVSRLNAVREAPHPIEGPIVFVKSILDNINSYYKKPH